MTMKLVSAAIVGAFCMAGASQAATLVNGSFESPGDWAGTFRTYGNGNTSLTGWKIEASGVDHINTLWQHSDGSYSLDMSASNAGVITQKVSDLVVGAAYTVLFDMAGNVGSGNVVKSLKASFGGAGGIFTFDTTGKSNGNMGWVTHSFSFVAATTESVLRFESLDRNAWGAALDNVRLEEDLTAVPLPASGLLLLAGLGGLRSLRRKSKG